MKSVLIAVVFCAFSSCVLRPCLAADADSTRLEDLSPDQRKQRIRDEIESRRRQQVEAMLRSPGVWQPGADVAEADYPSIAWRNAPIGFVAQFYAVTG